MTALPVPVTVMVKIPTIFRPQVGGNRAVEEMPGDPLKQNPTSGSLTLTSVRTVVAGDSLASIAYREYGDPGMWRPLALFNGIDDPLRLRLGSSVLLPVVDDLMAGV